MLMLAAERIFLGAVVIYVFAMVIRVVDWANKQKYFDNAPGDIKNDQSVLKVMSAVGLAAGSIYVLLGCYNLYQMYAPNQKRASEPGNFATSAQLEGGLNRFARYL